MAMKRIITIISVFTALLAVSCTNLDELVNGDEGKGILTLEFNCGEMQTRSEGDDNYNENTIDHVDYFFFSDEAGTTPLGIYGRYTVSTENPLTFDTTTDQYAALKGTSYLYVLANYPDEIDFSTVTTLEQILALPVTKDVYTNTGDKAATGVLPDCFLMDTYSPATETTAEKYTVKLSATEQDEERTETVTLVRLAVKLTMKLTLDASITTHDTFGNTETWTPSENLQLQVYYVNALNNTTVKAEPAVLADNTDGIYFDYPTDYGYAADPESARTWITEPFYTYPQQWTGDDNGEPYFKVIMNWKSSVKGDAPFYYKVEIPTEKTLKRNSWYQVTLRVGVLGGTESNYVKLTDYYYCVADWAEPAWFSGSGLNSARYFYVPATEIHIYGDDKTDIPYYCNTTVNAYFTEIRYWDYNATTGSAYNPQTGVSIERVKNDYTSSSTSVNDWGGSSNHTYTVTPNSDEKVVKFTHSMTDLYVQREIHLRIVNSENTAQYKDVIIYQHPAIELKKAAAGDVFVNGHFARVSDARNANGQSFGTSYNGYRHSTIGWYGNGSRITNNGTSGYGCVLFDPTGGGSSTVSSSFFTTDITVTAFGTNNNTYTITGEGEVEYKIGDPRVKASAVYNNFTLNSYLASGNSANGNWTNVGDVMICSQAQNERNVIAPRILISSGLTELILGDQPTGGSNASTLFSNFVKRGATYQEAGYPAGRWRLPTEGEVAFIAARQFDETIPDIFNRDVPYYCSSGRWVIIPSSGTTLTFGTDVSQRIRVWGSYHYIYELLDAKFVYDLWYWGDKPAWDGEPASGQYVTNQYHPNGHVQSYKNQ